MSTPAPDVLDAQHASHLGTPPGTVDAQRAFLGCLMHCPHQAAQRLLAGIQATDATGGLTGDVLWLAIRVTTAGTAPDPAVLLAEARTQGLLTTEQKYKHFSLWLLDTYRMAPFPESGPALKAAFLETALRHALRGHAHRLIQHADTASLDDLRALAEPDDRLADLWNRHNTENGRAITPENSRKRGTDDLSAFPEHASYAPTAQTGTHNGEQPTSPTHANSAPNTTHQDAA